MFFFSKVNERSHSKKPSSKDHITTKLTTIKSTTKSVDSELGNEIQTNFRPDVIRIRKNEDDNHISNQITQLLKAKKNSSSIVKVNVWYLLFISVFIVLHTFTL